MIFQVGNKIGWTPTCRVDTIHSGGSHGAFLFRQTWRTVFYWRTIVSPPAPRGVETDISWASCIMEQRPQQHIMRRSPTIPPSMPLLSLTFPLVVTSARKIIKRELTFFSLLFKCVCTFLYNYIGIEFYKLIPTRTRTITITIGTFTFKINLTSAESFTSHHALWLCAFTCTSGHTHLGSLCTERSSTNMRSAPPHTYGKVYIHMIFRDIFIYFFSQALSVLMRLNLRHRLNNPQLCT
jgi:hypothetical protein